jgi:hypothetical protein
MLHFKAGFFGDAMGGQSADPRSYNDDLHDITSLNIFRVYALSTFKRHSRDRQRVQHHNTSNTDFW